MAASGSTGRVISPRLEPAARGIAYVPQNYGLFPHLTVSETTRWRSRPAPIRDLCQALDRPARSARPRNLGNRMRCRSASSNASPWRALAGAPCPSAFARPNRSPRSMRRSRARLRRGNAAALQKRNWARRGDPGHPRSGRGGDARRRNPRSGLRGTAAPCKAGPTDQVFRR